MCGKPFVFYNMSKTYKVYDINLTLRKLKGRMTKVIRFLYVYRSLESLLSKRPIYIQIRALALAFQFARARGERQGMSERSDEIPPHKTIGPNSRPNSASFDSIESKIYFI